MVSIVSWCSWHLFQEIQSLDNKIHETVETINTMKIQREFFLSFAKEPQLFINKWLISQSRGNFFLFIFGRSRWRQQTLRSLVWTWTNFLYQFQSREDQLKLGRPMQYLERVIMFVKCIQYYWSSLNLFCYLLQILKQWRMCRATRRKSATPTFTTSHGLKRPSVDIFTRKSSSEDRSSILH